MEYIPFDLEDLTEDMIKKAEIELGETKQQRKTSLIALRSLVQKEIEEKNLNCPVEDCFLLQFLRARKFNVQKSFNLLQNYFHGKQNCAILQNLDFDSVLTIFQDEVCDVLPYRDIDGAMLCVCRGRNFKMDDFSRFVHAACYITRMCVDLHPATQVCGFKVIADMKDTPLRTLLKISPRLAYIMIKHCTNEIPVRFRAYHMMNTPTMIIIIWNAIKIFLPTKIRDRFYFHSSDYKVLHNIINPQLLPEDFEGTLSITESPILNRKDLEQKYYEHFNYGYL